jgi:hypothetical protein
VLLWRCLLTKGRSPCLQLPSPFFQVGPHHLVRCEAGPCATPCTPPHGPFNRVQDKNIQGACPSKSGIEVTKSGFSSNIRGLRSPSDLCIARTTHPTTVQLPPNALIVQNPFPRVHTPYEHDVACYNPQEWYGPTNSGHPGLGILFPHLRSHQHSNASLIQCSFHSSKPLETHSDASRRVFRPITDHL